jgi:hypothetical protein
MILHLGSGVVYLRGPGTASNPMLAAREREEPTAAKSHDTESHSFQRVSQYKKIFQAPLVVDMAAWDLLFWVLNGFSFRSAIVN